MTVRQYENFDLLVEAVAEGHYRARVVASPIGDTPAVSFALPFEGAVLENLLLRLDPGRSGTRRSPDARTDAGRQLGGGLFEAVFTDDVALAWSRSRDATREVGKGLRLRLRLDEAPGIAGLPWELLYDKRTNTFISQSERTPVVRYLDVPQRLRPLRVEGPLRVLVVVASPTDLPELDVDAEWRGVKEALAERVADGRVVVDLLPAPTLAELGHWLRHQDVHILHFVGHGEVDRTIDEGVLYFCDPYGRSAAVTASVLGAYVNDHDPLRLLVLNACRSASPEALEPLGGLAQRIVRQNASAVVAMQFPITDKAAATFTREFYGAVADGFPVDQAATYARKALLAGFGAEWATPVVFMRAADGRVFEAVEPPEDAPPEPRPEPEPTAPRAAERAPLPSRSAPLIVAPAVAARTPVTHETPQPTPEPADGDDDGLALTYDVRGVRRRRPRLLLWIAAVLAATVGIWLAVARPWVPEPTPITGGSAETAPSGDGASQPQGPSGGGDQPVPTRAAAPAIVLEAARLPAAPTIDGRGDEWADTPTLAADNAVAVRAEGTPPVSSAWQLGWDDSYLYLFVRVEDTAIVQTHADDPSQLWRGDGICFEFGPYQREVSTTKLDAADVQVLIGPTEVGTVVVGRNVASGSVIKAGPPPSGIEARVVVDGSGYAVEARVPWPDLNISRPPSAGTQFAMNLNVSNAIADGDKRGDLAVMYSNNADRHTANAANRYLWGQLTLIR